MGFWLHTGDRSSAHGKRVWTRRVPCPNLHATRGNPSRILARRGRRDRLRQRRAIPHAEGDALALKPSSADAGSRACRSALAATAALGAPSLSTHRGAEAPFRSATPAPAGLVEDKRRSESVSVASIICRWCVDQAERGRCLIPSPGLIEPAAGILGVSSPTRRRGTNPPEIIGTQNYRGAKSLVSKRSAAVAGTLSRMDTSWRSPERVVLWIQEATATLLLDQSHQQMLSCRAKRT
jgi:hypothetical protein